MSPTQRAKYLTYYFLRKLVRFVIPLCMRVKVKGRKNAPGKGPFILVSNHRFDLDAFLITYALDAPITWVAADFLSRLPVSNLVVWLFGMITVSKGRKNDNNFMNLKKIISCLRDGGNIGIFPEGMDYLIAADFQKPMAPFYRGFSKIAARLGIPVYPVTIIPHRELVHRYPIPKSIRRLFNVSPEMQDLPVRNTYRSVTITFSPVLRPNMELDTERRAVDVFIQTRATIEENLRNYSLR